MVVLIDCGNMYKRIHNKVAKEFHCFVRVVSNLQFLIIDGGTMKCTGYYENIKLQMGDYHLKTHMFSIEMGSCDTSLGS